MRLFGEGVSTVFEDCHNCCFVVEIDIFFVFTCLFIPLLLSLKEVQRLQQAWSWPLQPLNIVHEAAVSVQPFWLMIYVMFGCRTVLE